MQIIPNFNLTPCNTLAVSATADFFCAPKTLKELQEALVWAQEKGVEVHILGDGSNILLQPKITGLTICPSMLNKDVSHISDTIVEVTFGAGENWHEIVTWCLSRNFYGLENLALIPGSVGAAPVQNIGAYGVELESIFVQLSAVDIKTGKRRVFTHSQCEFSYRDSIFKQKCKAAYIIVDVTMRLSKVPNVNVSYPALAKALSHLNVPTPDDVFRAVCATRKQKLPAPEDIPNCGSFFKNPILSPEQFQTFIGKNPAAVYFDLPNSQNKKIAAAWLIDQAGWKGKQRYDVAVHTQQALVLVNPKRSSVVNVLKLATDIQEDIQNKFSIHLELEPQRIGL